METKYIHALVDLPSHRVLAIGSIIPHMTLLQESMPGTQLFFSINHPNYTNSLFRRIFFNLLAPEQYPEWTWEISKRRLVKKGGKPSKELSEKSHLAIRKHEIINIIAENLNLVRFKKSTGVFFQDKVYMTKRLQAETFKSSGYNEDTIMEYPYVMQYADYAHLSFKEATEEILLKAKLDDQYFANSELLRLKYSNKLKRAQTIKELETILKEFQSDCFYV